MSNNGHPGYDEKLLAAAPAVDKGMLQEGYTTDLLEKPKASPTPPPDLEAGRKQPPRSQRNYSTTPPAAKPLPLPEKTPFFRTTKGIIIIVVALVVVLAAVIGGAVGGTRKKNNKVDDGGQSAGSGSTTSGGTSVSQTHVTATGPDIGPSPTMSTISRSTVTSVPTTIPMSVPDNGVSSTSNSPQDPVASAPTPSSTDATSPDGSEPLVLSGPPPPAPAFGESG